MYLKALKLIVCSVGDISGIAPVPFYAAYCASKAAVAFMSEVLRVELGFLGIRVSTIIPSGYRTGKWTKGLWVYILSLLSYPAGTALVNGLKVSGYICYLHCHTQWVSHW